MMDASFIIYKYIARPYTLINRTQQQGAEYIIYTWCGLHRATVLFDVVLHHSPSLRVTRNALHMEGRK